MTPTHIERTPQIDIDPSKINLAEKDIEEYLWQHPRIVSSAHWRVERWLKRQFRVPSGIIDLLGVSSDGNFVVVEIKNTPIDGRAVAQVCRYAHDIYCVIDTVAAVEPDLLDLVCIKVVIGPSLEDVTLAECEACDVEPFCFTVRFHIDIGTVIWSPEHLHWRDAEYMALSEDDDLVGVMKGYLQQHVCQTIESEVTL